MCLRRVSPCGATYFAHGGKVGKTPLGVASEQTTAFRLGLQFRAPQTPGDATGEFCVVRASVARRGAGDELTSFLRRCRSSFGYWERLRCFHNAPGAGKI